MLKRDDSRPDKQYPTAKTSADTDHEQRNRHALDEDLHASTQTQHQVQGGLLLDVVVSQSAAILELLASKDQALLVRGNALLVLDLALHVLDGVRRLHLQSDGLASQGPAGRSNDMSEHAREG